jgi:hypothetical protein
MPTVIYSTSAATSGGRTVILACVEATVCEDGMHLGAMRLDFNRWSLLQRFLPREGALRDDSSPVEEGLPWYHGLICL